MYIRNRDEALDALGTVLALEERREQIIQITVKVALCLDPDARKFLAACQEGLIEGGLDYMRDKRRRLLEAQAAQSEPIILIDSSTDQLYEAVGASIDALRVTDIVLQVFPVIAKRFQRWEVARAVLGEEAAVQEAVKAAIRERGTGGSDLSARMQAQVIEKVLATRPPWADQASRILEAVQQRLRDPNTGQADPKEVDLVYNVLAVHEDSARLVMDFLGTSPPEAYAYIDATRERIEQLLALEERAEG